MSSSNEPTYRDAMAGLEKDQWLAAMQDELNRICKMQTYNLVERPTNANIVGAVWSLRKKRNEHNKLSSTRLASARRASPKCPA